MTLMSPRGGQRFVFLFLVPVTPAAARSRVTHRQRVGRRGTAATAPHRLRPRFTEKNDSETRPLGVLSTRELKRGGLAIYQDGSRQAHRNRQGAQGQGGTDDERAEKGPRLVRRAGGLVNVPAQGGRKEHAQVAKRHENREDGSGGARRAGSGGQVALDHVAGHVEEARQHAILHAAGDETFTVAGAEPGPMKTWACGLLAWSAALTVFVPTS